MIPLAKNYSLVSSICGSVYMDVFDMSYLIDPPLDAFDASYTFDSSGS